MYKKGDKVIILDYNQKPVVPNVVAVVEDVIAEDRLRLLLPDNGCCLEFTNLLQKIDEKKYNSILESVKEREKELPVDLQIDIRRFASKHPRRRKDEIFHMTVFFCLVYGRGDRILIPGIRMQYIPFSVARLIVQSLISIGG